RSVFQFPARGDDAPPAQSDRTGAASEHSLRPWHGFLVKSVAASRAVHRDLYVRRMGSRACGERWIYHVCAGGPHLASPTSESDDGRAQQGSAVVGASIEERFPGAAT